MESAWGLSARTYFGDAATFSGPDVGTGVAVAVGASGVGVRVELGDGMMSGVGTSVTGRVDVAGGVTDFVGRVLVRVKVAGVCVTVPAGEIAGVAVRSTSGNRVNPRRPKVSIIARPKVASVGFFTAQL